MKYSNTTLKTLTFEPSLNNEIIDFWNNLTAMEWISVRQHVKIFKDITLTGRACLNYVFDNYETLKTQFKKG